MEGHLSSSRAIQIHVQKAQNAYFQYGSIYAFPVSCCSVVETCVLPVLYGVENWVLSPKSIQMPDFPGRDCKEDLAFAQVVL